MYKPPSFSAQDIMGNSNHDISKGNVKTLARKLFKSYVDNADIKLILTNLPYGKSIEEHHKIVNYELTDDLLLEIVELIRLKRLDEIL